MVLADNIQTIKGIGEKKAKLFEKMGVKTVEDLLFYFPFRYEDRKTYRSLEQISEEGSFFSSGIVVAVQTNRIKPKMTVTKLIVRSLTKEAVLTIFNNPYIEKRYPIGTNIQFYGTCQKTRGRIQFSSPEIEEYGKNSLMSRIYPIYPLVKGIGNQDVIKAVAYALEELNDIMDYLPKRLLEGRKLAPLDFALRNIHFAKDISALKSARYRMIYEEFFMLQLNLHNIRGSRSHLKAFPLFEKKQMQEWISSLPFELTDAQKRVLCDLEQDMQKDTPMQRLIQGDVGSGKTIIAWYGCYLAYLNGYQSVMMAPTEVLAKQHYEGAKKIFADTQMKITFLSGSVSKKKKEEIYQAIEEGEYHLVIGTHALLQDGVCFKKLALAITDEQHRFGVKQRNRLSNVYEISPHILVMTATPIPRTLTLVLQGDLDVSIIDELPKGRKRIVTKTMEYRKKNMAYQHCLQELAKGRQVYIVCPLVSESEALDLKSAEELYESLKTGMLKDYSIGLLHGKMKASEKTEIMRRYEQREIDVLVSTTVIEVGINVPNATVMIIEDAQRFGLSQLHQLRGRVGRGSEQSYCFLLYKGYDEILLQRMQVMSSTEDGFLIAEKDLEIRGPGEVLGLRQHGLPELKLADFTKHQKVMFSAKKDVEDILNEKIKLDKIERLILDNKIEETMERKMRDLAMN